MFVQVSDCNIVNLEQIEYVDLHTRTVNLIGGGIVFTSEEYEDSIRDALLQYKRN